MTKRHLGQVFLYDPSILERIIQAAQLSEEDLVVEIGPGGGRLTKMLAGRVKNVIAIELDEELFEELKVQLVDYPNVELFHVDALKYPYERLPEFKLVANIPYYITTPLIFRLIDARKNLKSMTLTIQKEVAERIVAGSGGKDYGVLSVMVQYYAGPKLKFVIPKGAFRPIPKIDSALVYFKILQKPLVQVKDEKFFFRVVKMAFSQRRKMLSQCTQRVKRRYKRKTRRDRD